MEAKVIAIKERPSRHGGKFYVVCMQSFEPKVRSLMTYVFQGADNYVRWKRVMELTKTHEIVLDGLAILKGRIVNADSLFTINHQKSKVKEKEKEAICQTSQ